MNDGEIGLMHDSSENCIASRGYQKSSKLLSEKLKEALNYNSPDYFIGLPCEWCNWRSYHLSKTFLTENYPQDNILNANILINSNVNRTIEIFQSEFSKEKQKNIIVVTNSKLSKNIKELEKLNIHISKVIEVSHKNAFDIDYERIKDEWSVFQDNSVILCLCGPLGRVLCYEWYKNNNTFTCLELGSFFDPLLAKKSYSYHQNTLPFCKICFQSRLQHRAFHNIIPSYLDANIEPENFYFYSVEDYLTFYHNNFDSVKDVIENRFKKYDSYTYNEWNKILDKIQQSKNE
jgi:hypothetical protein